MGEALGNAIRRLLPAPLVTHDGPSTMTVSVLHQPEKSRVCVHILSYIPVRKSATIDSIEERTRLVDVTLKWNLPFAVSSARTVPDNRELPVNNNAVVVPEVDGYCIIELGYEGEATA